MKYPNGDLIEQMQDLINQGNYAVQRLTKNGNTFAEKERDYKIKLREIVLKLKEDKVPATLIQLVAYGDPEVAKLRYERDCAESIYKANQEALQWNKLQIKILNDQVDREWGSNGTGQ